jgi:uncharacterized protein YqgQ
MSTPNYITQPFFNLYANEHSFLIYPYAIDPETDDFLIDENGEYVVDYDADPIFDYSYFEDCKDYTDEKLNSKLAFFRISFEDGYYSGIQTFIEPKYPNDLDALDYMQYPQYYDSQQLFKDFGYNTYILKRKIQAEINLINNKLLPQLKKEFLFDKLGIYAQFSNGETIYIKE